jgi:hypothetical protein
MVAVTALWFDDNPSRQLVRRLSDRFPSSEHLCLAGLLRGRDYATAGAEGLIRRQSIRIAVFVNEPVAAVLFLRKGGRNQ